MSIATQIDALTTDRNDIRTQLVAKGISAASGHGFDDFAADIAAIITGGGGSGLPPFTAIETGTWECTADIARPTINFNNTHSAPPAVVLMSDITGSAYGTTNSNMIFVLVDFQRLCGSGFPYSSSAVRAAFVFCVYRATSTTSLSTMGLSITNSGSNTGASSTAYFRYWADASSFRPYCNNTGRYWRSGRTYKWYALWI